MRLAGGTIGGADADYAMLTRALARAQAATPTGRLARALAAAAAGVNEDDPGLYPDGQAFLSPRQLGQSRAGREAARTIREPR